MILLEGSKQAFEVDSLVFAKGPSLEEPSLLGNTMLLKCVSFSYTGWRVGVLGYPMSSSQQHDLGLCCCRTWVLVASASMLVSP